MPSSPTFQYLPLETIDPAVPVENGTKARIVGRTTQGFISPALLFESEPVTLFKKLPIPTHEHEGYYFAGKMVQKGDSGGPVFAEDPDRQEGEPRTITGVVSTMHYMTRVDMVNDWISSFLPEATD